MINGIINGQHSPGNGLLLAIVMAFGITLVDVFQAAGIVQATDHSVSDLADLMHLKRQMSPEDHEEVMAYARFEPIVQY